MVDIKTKLVTIAIVGKAGSGKDTVCKLIYKHRHNYFAEYSTSVCKMAFADPVKEIAKKMYPFLSKKVLYGPSKLRSTVIPNSFKNGQPLTIRQLLIDIGTLLGRSYNDQIWIDNMDYKIEQLDKKIKSRRYHSNTILVVTDVRFRNEFDKMKSAGFFMVKLERNDHTNINDISETQQDGIKDNEFDFILKNNGTLKDLEKEINDRLMPIILNSV